mgnify:CR=1 FL=1
MLMPVIMSLIAVFNIDEMFSKTQVTCVLTGYVGVLFVTNPSFFENV